MPRCTQQAGRGPEGYGGACRDRVCQAGAEKWGRGVHGRKQMVSGGQGVGENTEAL